MSGQALIGRQPIGNARRVRSKEIQPRLMNWDSVTISAGISDQRISFS